MVQSPGFTAVAIVTIATGIGVTATVLTFVNALLIRPAPGVREPATLVSVFTSDYSSGPFGATSYPDYLSLKTSAPAFARLAAYRTGSVVLLRTGADVERVRTGEVSGEFFDTVGVGANVGRTLNDRDTDAGAPPVAMIGEALWHRAFGGNASALGRTIAVNGVGYTIVGVVPREFTGLELGFPFEVWTPLVARDGALERGNRSYRVIGRLRGGTSAREAQAQLDAIAAQLAAAYPETNRGTLAQPEDPRAMTARPHTRLAPQFRGEVKMVSAVLLSAILLLLLIACANVAGLLLSRAASRSREVAVRLALGASRVRLVRQMLTESIVMALAGGSLGVLASLWTADALPSFFPPDQARILDARVDWRVLMSSVAVAMASGVIFGLAPAFHALRASAASVLRGTTSGAAEMRRGGTARRVLVIGQVSLALVLLLSATLLTRSLTNALHADLGFTTREAVVCSIELPSSLPPARVSAYYEALVDAIGTIPGVEAAGLARSVPVAGVERRGFRPDGYTPRAGEDLEFHVNAVSRQYFAAMGIAAADGRLFDERDRPEPAAVVVNDVLAARYYNGRAVGHRIYDSRGTGFEIIGVVRAQRLLGLQDPPLPVVFFALEHDPTRRVMLVARTSGDAAIYADAVRRRAASVDRDAAIFRTVTLEAHLAEGVATNRIMAALITWTGVIAFALALVGVYGIVAYAVVRRTREIGVRVALGARPGQVLALLALESGRIVAIGILVGTLAALGASRLLSSLLYGVSATDPMTFVALPVILAAITMLASCAPAFRALRIDPVVALRHD
jgi:predicted permease